LIFHQQSHLKYLEDGEEPMFDLLKPVPQLLSQECQLQHPFDKYRSVLQELERRQKEIRRRLAKEKAQEKEIQNFIAAE
jgi:hypothetical protein